ncbi:xylose isomerase-like protein [Naematelia encephala]|uniref:Xylose isomerase-like protein n=1 Tax=Naematelia encephala TaxID=71784 RepID=A0A1Y2B7E5_9TREE|nr:xylose isomerase-like protein [Naematelia encephala]
MRIPEILFLHSSSLSDMKVLWFRSTWGIDHIEWPDLFRRAKALDYDGIEFNLHRAGPPEGYFALKTLLDDLELKVIVQTFSSWVNYAGPRPPGLTCEDHIAIYRQHLKAAKFFEPVQLNVQSGVDYWSREDSIQFYRQTIEIDRELGLSGRVCHETHRNRSLFHPYVTAHILQVVPELRLTGDLSHWTCVCERLLDVSSEDVEVLNQVIPHIQHIHARIGTTQSSQCPTPADHGYAAERSFFQSTWKKIIERVHRDGKRDWISIVPEYGAYPYQPLYHPQNFSELADLEKLRLEPIFSNFLRELNEPSQQH